MPSPRNREEWRRIKTRPYISPLLSTARWKRLREELYIEANGLCAHCNTLTIPGHPYLNYNIDHIKPINHHKASREKVFDRSNLQLLCASCHLHKTKDESAVPQPQKFYVDPITGDISTSPPEFTKEFMKQRKIEHTRNLIQQGKIQICPY